MSIKFGEKDMEFDGEHILEDFRDMYDNVDLIVIFEVISNSIDVDATKVELKLRQNEPLPVPKVRKSGFARNN